MWFIYWGWISWGRILLGGGGDVPRQLSGGGPGIGATHDSRGRRPLLSERAGKAQVLSASAPRTAACPLRVRRPARAPDGERAAQATWI